MCNNTWRIRIARNIADIGLEDRQYLESLHKSARPRSCDSRHWANMSEMLDFVLSAGDHSLDGTEPAAMTTPMP